MPNYTGTELRIWGNRSWRVMNQKIEFLVNMQVEGQERAVSEGNSWEKGRNA